MSLSVVTCYMFRGVGTDFGLGRQKTKLGGDFFLFAQKNFPPRSVFLKYWVGSCPPCLPGSDAPVYVTWQLQKQQNCDNEIFDRKL